MEFGTVVKTEGGPEAEKVEDAQPVEKHGEPRATRTLGPRLKRANCTLATKTDRKRLSAITSWKYYSFGVRQPRVLVTGGDRVGSVTVTRITGSSWN